MLEKGDTKLFYTVGTENCLSESVSETPADASPAPSKDILFIAKFHPSLLVHFTSFEKELTSNEGFGQNRFPTELIKGWNSEFDYRSDDECNSGEDEWD